METQRLQEVQVFGLQKRPQTKKNKRPWAVRWAVDGRQRSRTFATKAEADRVRMLLAHAQHRGEAFDEETGEPLSWRPAETGVTVYAWARRWLAEQWPEWQPRTRDSAVEAIVRFVPLAVNSSAPPAPVGLRAHLKICMRPGSTVSVDDPFEDWLAAWSLPLKDLDRPTLAEIDRLLGLGDSGQQLAASSSGRFRKVARSCIRRAVDLEILAADPWPPAPRGRSRRKSTRVKKSIDIRSLPGPATMALALDAMVSHQPASSTYQLMTAVMYYAGLRPSETVMLRPHALHLPAEGWGRIDVLEADISFDEPGEPKTGERSVPIPPVLVAMLRSWLASHDFATDELIFRSRTGRRPHPSNWARCWQLALGKIGCHPLRVYDCRHAAATTWLSAGVPLGEVARRMGHSVETLVSTYVGALSGDEQIANERIETLLAQSVADTPLGKVG